MSAGDGPRQRGRRGPSQGSSRSTHGLCPCWGTRSQHRRQGRVGQAEAWPARPRAQTRGWGRGAPTAPEAGGAPAAGLTAVDVREALRGDGVGRVLVDVLQAQAGQLRLVEEARLRRAARQRRVSALGAWAPTGCRARGRPQPRAERSPARAPSKRRGTQRRTAAGMVGRANPGKARPGPSRGPRTTSGTRKSVPETCCVRNRARGGGGQGGDTRTRSAQNAWARTVLRAWPGDRTRPQPSAGGWEQPPRDSPGSGPSKQLREVRAQGKELANPTCLERTETVLGGGLHLCPGPSCLSSPQGNLAEHTEPQRPSQRNKGNCLSPHT